MNSKITSNPGICRVGGILSTLILLIGIIVLGAIVADMYGIVQKTDKRSSKTQEFVNATSSQVNKTVAQLLAGQINANIRGNGTILSFEKLFDQVLGTEENIIGNLSDHRKIANLTRDVDQEMLKEILNILVNKTTR